MSAIFLPIPEDLHESIRRSAASSGMSMRRWCRTMLAQAAGRTNGDGENDLFAMIEDIRSAVCCQDGLEGEAGAALEALLQLNMPPKAAQRRVEGIVGANPALTAAQIIKEALSE